MKIIVNRRSIEISSYKDAIRTRISGLLLWKLAGVLILSFAMWTLCHKADGRIVKPGQGFSHRSTGDAEEMRTYTVVDGLVGPVVPAIFQDSRGFLWFGSESGGVSRFDGDTFEQFRLEDDLSNGVTAQILEDRWGRIWFLTQLPTEREGVVSYFNGTNIETVGVATCMTVDSDGAIWAADDRGLTHYTSSSPIEHGYNAEAKISSIKSTRYYFQGTPDATINVLFESKDGTFWLGGSAVGGVLLLSFEPDGGFKDEVADIATPPPVFTSKDGTFTIQDITQGAYGIDHLWFAGRNLLLQFDGETFHQILPDPRNREQTDTHTEDPNDTRLYHDFLKGYIWFSSGGKVRWWDGNRLGKVYQDNSQTLVMEQNKGTREFHYGSTREFFGTLKMHDTLGSLWFATPTGAHRYNPVSWLDKTYTVADGIEGDNIETIFEAADGKIWFGHNNGATVSNPQSAFLNYKTRPAIGSNSIHQIYDGLFGLLFIISGGVASNSGSLLYQQKLHPEHTLNQVESESNVSPVEGESAPKPVESEDKRAEIVGFFQDGLWNWFINRPERTPTETLYTFFAKEYDEFEQLSIRVQTEIGRESQPEAVISGPEATYIAFGGWLFKPYSHGLKWLSPDGTRTFEFQDTPRFEDIPEIKHGPSAIVDMHTDQSGKIWCYLEDGTVQSYPNLNDLYAEDFPEVVLPEIVPMTHIKPLRLPNPKIISDGSSENAVPKWFFNHEKGQILYWDIEKLGEPTTVEGVFNVPPLAIWESADAAETAFIFSDHLKKYRGTQLIHEEKVSVAEVNAALFTNAQVLWLATKKGAVRYDGTTLKTYGIEDGFLVNDLRDVLEDDREHIWFATWGGGAVRYDGETFTPVTTRDRLAHNSVSDIYQSSDGPIWFATEGGITRYTPTDGALPFCNITTMKADKTYTDIPETRFAFPSRVKDITFNFEGINPLRLRNQLTYEFKLLGLGENSWTRGTIQTPTHLLQGTVTQTFATSAATDTSEHRGPSVTYQGLKPGNYTFLIKTYRKGWPYTSTPAAVNFTIDTPFWAKWRSYLPYLILIGLLITIVPYLLARLLVNRRRVARLHAEMQQKEEAEMQQLRAELDEARNMQAALLPTEVPEVEGLDVAGMSLPATQVGGDFYDYLNAGENHLAIAVADAAGKGLRGALNAVLTNGMLNEIVQIQYSADVILTNLNTSLTPRLYGRTFIALNLAIIDPESKQMLYANAGQPYPILKRGDVLIEIESSELPLGGMKRIEYGQERLELAPGDIYIFYTDGVIEALNSEEEMYGTERLKSVLTEAPEHLNAEELIAYIFKDIQAFVQEAEQYDDITIVIVRHQPITQ